MGEKQEYFRISRESEHEYLNHTHAIQLEAYGFVQCGIAYCREEFTVRRTNMHKHMLLYTIKGKGWFECEGKREILIPGTVVKVNSNVENSFGIEESDWQIAWIFLSPDRDWSGTIPKTFSYCDSGESDAIYAVILSILRSKHLPLELNKQVVDLALKQLKILVKESVSVKRQSQQIKLDRVFEEAQKQLHREWDVGQLSALYPCSPPHFYRLCNEYFGQSPMSYLTRLRMEYAASLLTSTYWSIQQIGEIIGYPVAANFSSRFKAWSSLSPRQYRKQYQPTHSQRHNSKDCAKK